MLDRLGLTREAAQRYPQQLSGGMRQRVSLARALVLRPPVLLMDEPFGALDALTRLQVRYDLEHLWMSDRPTVLFITHSVEEAVGLSDRVLVMSPSPGEVVEELRIDIPRPRPLTLGEDRGLEEYSQPHLCAFRPPGRDPPRSGQAWPAGLTSFRNTLYGARRHATSFEHRSSCSQSITATGSV